MNASPLKDRWTESPRIAVVGGGLAGLAAGCALSESGFPVTLFERKPFLGGRASSYQHPGTGEIIDNCQHVLFGCCTNLIEFYERIGIKDNIRWYDSMTFIEPGGRSSILKGSPLPAPLHTAPSLLRFPFLSTTDKFAISSAVAALTMTPQGDTGRSFLQWLNEHHQTENAIQRFWKPILVSALSEDLDFISIAYASQVVRESMKSPGARQMGVPTIPLTELYNYAGDYIAQRGGEIQLRSGINSFRAEPSGVQLLTAAGELRFDFVVFAVPFDGLRQMLPDTTAAEPLRKTLGNFQSSPITGVHLWFDRKFTDLDHAVLLDRTIQWMFNKSKLLDRPSEGSYIELVVSSSKQLLEMPRQEIIDLALKEMREFFPEAKDAELIKAAVIKEVHATYSPRPGIDLHRPSPETVWPRVFLAGDWTATGWPATMEGAVRSGYIAAERVARVAGLSKSAFLVRDLPASGFMRLFG